MNIFIILLGLSINYFSKDISSLRSFTWLNKIQQGFHPATKHLSPIAQRLIPLTLSILLLYIISTSIHTIVGPLFQWVLSVIVLLYCLGPEDLSDIRHISQANNDDEVISDIKKLIQAPLATDQLSRNEQAIGGVFRIALQRWFAVIFWFNLFGIYGAFAYRVCSVLSQQQNHTAPTSSPSELLQLQRLFEWPVAQLMTLAIALAANFDIVYKIWHQYHQKHGFKPSSGDYSYMLQAANISIQGSKPAGVGISNTLSGTSGTVQIALSLLYRILTVWLTLLVIILLASWLF